MLFDKNLMPYFYEIDFELEHMIICHELLQTILSQSILGSEALNSLTSRLQLLLLLLQSNMDGYSKY